MKSFNVALFGCGTVGGGVVKIIREINDDLKQRAGMPINLSKIVELDPSTASKRFDIPLDLFCGGGNSLNKEQATTYINDIIKSDEIDLIVETIGGTSDFVYNLVIGACKAGKHVVTANKALLAKRGKGIYDTAIKNEVSLGFEAAVCGSIPIIKTIIESFSGDSINSISGIMNGTSNYILSRMQDEGQGFDEALKMAQEKGYAEADPTLDINGHDAGHKLVILAKLAFGLDLTMEQLAIKGTDTISKEEADFAKEIDSSIKLICFAQKMDGHVYATVCPMLVKKSNFLAEVGGATNAVLVDNIYGGHQTLIGAGAGSSETASSIVADIIFIARHKQSISSLLPVAKLEFKDAKYFKFPYIITFETPDVPGITGLVTTAIGNHNINIDTVSHNMHRTEKAIFSIATMPCSKKQIEDAVAEIRKKKPDILLSEPKIMPILY
jgi:homoserine dehydrogenase